MNPQPKPVPRYYAKRQRKRDQDRAWQAARKTVLLRDGGRCRACGKPAFDVHHVVYRSQGGPNSADNGVSVCRLCHDAIHGHALRVLGSNAATCRFEWVDDADRP